MRDVRWWRLTNATTSGSDSCGGRSLGGKVLGDNGDAGDKQTAAAQTDAYTQREEDRVVAGRNAGRHQTNKAKDDAS